MFVDVEQQKSNCYRKYKQNNGTDRKCWKTVTSRVNRVDPTPLESLSKHELAEDGISCFVPHSDFINVLTLKVSYVNVINVPLPFHHPYLDKTLVYVWMDGCVKF